uniref:Uncharacterized protein n=1 Tax=Opuntia streptacantha TaxID=393608 RepID=A0A7C9EV53_OPUST
MTMPSQSRGIFSSFFSSLSKNSAILLNSIAPLVIIQLERIAATKSGNLLFGNNMTAPTSSGVGTRELHSIIRPSTAIPLAFGSKSSEKKKSKSNFSTGNSKTENSDLTKPQSLCCSTGSQQIDFLTSWRTVRTSSPNIANLLRVKSICMDTRST